MNKFVDKYGNEFEEIDGNIEADRGSGNRNEIRHKNRSNNSRSLAIVAAA